ncbi:uncharacterized protein Tco025E_02064 [Trypanosoma conorhini]|uniref:Uncharacterized protein n=1 Tax=Trypanosoma conorhini TaxID=83891 RepID=A0A3R7NR76_9TRYP|nr:uncharacterized protein Tco025E_02064 [Trypanosoma conorhini]RNF25809.1 hypothetical protein Tco025E_02064 [Trypanosoma conorhini]
MRGFVDGAGLWGERRGRAHGKDQICGAGKLENENSSATSNAASESATAVTPKSVTVTAAESNYDAVDGNDATAVFPSFGAEMDRHLLAVARASEFSALKALELCQQEVLQLQRMWDLDRETQRWTIASLQEEVRELRHQLERQRRYGSVQRTRESATAAGSLSALSVNGGDSSLRYTLGMEVGGANPSSEAPVTSGTEDSYTRTDTSAEHSSSFQCHHLGTDSARVEELEERVERYGRLLHDANKDCGELQAELSRVVRQLHDARRSFTHRISSLLREKEEMTHKHARTLAHLDETTGLLMVARAAERAALQRLSEGAQGESHQMCRPPTVEGGNLGEVYCLRCGCSSVACGEVLRHSVDVSMERQRCNSLALRQSTLEDEVCLLECEAERDTRHAEGMRRVIERLIDEVDGYARVCCAANQEAVGCLREMSLLWFAEDGAETDDAGAADAGDEDGHKSCDGVSLLQLQGGEERDGANRLERASSSALHSSPLLSLELAALGDTSAAATATAAECGAVVAPSGRDGPRQGSPR